MDNTRHISSKELCPRGIIPGPSELNAVVNPDQQDPCVFFSRKEFQEYCTTSCPKVAQCIQTCQQKIDDILSP